MSNSPDAIIQSHDEAMSIARHWADLNNANEDRCEAFASTWYEAGKDPEQSTAQALQSYLQRRLERQTGE